MTLEVRDILAQVDTHAAASGYFDTFLGHEPKSAPKGLTHAVWAQKLDPVPQLSGLVSATWRIAFSIRIYKPMKTMPQDAIDPDMLEAIDYLLGEYIGDFTLGGEVMQVDILGAYGVPLSAVAGYLDQDNRLHRVMTITLPLIIPDLHVYAE